MQMARGIAQSREFDYDEGFAFIFDAVVNKGKSQQAAIKEFADQMGVKDKYVQNVFYQLKKQRPNESAQIQAALATRMASSKKLPVTKDGFTIYTTFNAQVYAEANELVADGKSKSINQALKDLAEEKGYAFDKAQYSYYAEKRRLEKKAGTAVSDGNSILEEGEEGAASNEVVPVGEEGISEPAVIVAAEPAAPIATVVTAVAVPQQNKDEFYNTLLDIIINTESAGLDPQVLLSGFLPLLKAAGEATKARKELQEVDDYYSSELAKIEGAHAAKIDEMQGRYDALLEKFKIAPELEAQNEVLRKQLDESVEQAAKLRGQLKIASEALDAFSHERRELVEFFSIYMAKDSLDKIKTMADFTNRLKIVLDSQDAVLTQFDLSAIMANRPS